MFKRMTSALTSAPLAANEHDTTHGGSTREPAAFMRLGAGYRDLEIPSFDEIYGRREVVNTQSAFATHELEEFFADIEPTPISFRSRLGAWLQAMVVSRWKSWRRERETARTFANLSQMDDHVLRDIGVQDRLQLEYLRWHMR